DGGHVVHARPRGARPGAVSPDAAVRQGEEGPDPRSGVPRTAAQGPAVRQRRISPAGAEGKMRCAPIGRPGETCRSAPASAMIGEGESAHLSGVSSMTRYLTALLAGLLVLIAGTAAAADAKKLTIRWDGQSMFEITTAAGTRIVIDPHAIDAFGRKNLEADLILISHRHNDHTQIGV